MEVKKRKNCFLNRMATTLVVMSMIAAIMVFMLPNEQSNADEYVTAQAFEPVSGSTFSYDVKPGAVIRVRTGLQNFDRTVTDDQDSFSFFGLEASDNRIQTSDLKLLNGSGQYWPNLSEVGGDTVYDVSILLAPLTIDYYVRCSDDLPKGTYTITFYGMKYKDSTGTFVNQHSRDTSSYTLVKIPLVTYTLTNNIPTKKGNVKIEKISLKDQNPEPGKENELILRVKNDGKAEITELYVQPDFDLEKFVPNYEMKTINIGSIKIGELKTVKIPFVVGNETKKGLYELKVSLSGKDIYENDLAAEEIFYVTVGGKPVTPANAPVLSISTKQNYKLLKPSTDDSVILRIKNTGEKTATKVKLTCEEGFGVLTGLTKNYTDSYIKVEDIPAGKTVKVEVPFLVGAGFAKGVHELSFIASFEDEEKNAFTSDKMTMYVQHYKTDEVAEADGITYLHLSGVSQSPSSPVAGDKVTVSFTIHNKGTEKVTNLQFYGTNLSAAGFQPVSGEPYQDEGSLEAGESKKVTMSFRAGEDIPKGVNALTIGYDFFDSANKAQTLTTTIFVLNVINHKFDVIDVGRPKIIVSDYSTEPEIIRAGDTFDFTYTLKNTHTGKEARNIKITLSQAEGVLAPAQGTNIFYIDKLDPSQEVELSLPLKSRSDTVTGDYPVVLKLEYEYDDMSEIDKEHGGVSEENTLKIRVIENYRPVIENIYIDAYQGIIVGQPVDLNFEFYNMGKSTLGNVYITIEGDFALANNSAMSYVGAVQGYGQEYLSPQIVPLVGGESHGTVTIHFEDSNGDEQTKSSDFQAWVEDPMGGGDFGGDWNMNFGNISGGYYNGDLGGDFPFEEGEFGMEGDSVDEGFFESIPWWGWVIAGVVLVGGVVVVVIVVKKHKKKKESDEEDNEDI